MIDRLLVSVIIAVGLGLLWLAWLYYRRWVTHSIQPVEMGQVWSGALSSATSL